jgi:dynein heavy chain
VELQLERLQGNWMSFQQCLIDSEGMLKKHKEKFRTGLLHSAEDFKKTVSTLMDQFDTKGPFNEDVTIDDAMEFIARMRAELSQLKANESSIRKGLNIFKIEQPPSHLIQSMEKVRMALVCKSFDQQVYL